MIAHALDALVGAGAERIAVVVGPNRDDVAAEALKRAPGAEIFVQSERKGTAHATLAARAAIARGFDDILVTYADIPLISAQTLAALRDGLAGGARLVVLGFEAADPTGYGRLIESEGRLVAIREHKDASPGERAISPLQRRADGLRRRARRSRCSRRSAATTRNANSISPISSRSRGARGLRAEARMASEEEVMGVNDRVQLARAEAAMQRRLRRRAMIEGATLIAPETVFLSMDAKIGRDVTIEPHVVFGQGVTIDDGATIHAFSHLEGARVASLRLDRPLRAPAPRRRSRGEGQDRQLRRDQGRDDRGRRQGQPPELHRRRAGRRGRQHRRGHHHLQLRRLRQVQDRHRRRRLHRLQLGARRAGEDRRRRLCRLGLGDDRGRRTRRARDRARPAGEQAGLGEGVPGEEEGVGRRIPAPRLAVGRGRALLVCGRAARRHSATARVSPFRRGD